MEDKFETCIYENIKDLNEKNQLKNESRNLIKLKNDKFILERKEAILTFFS